MELSPYQRILLDRAVNLAPPQERPRRYGRRRHPTSKRTRKKKTSGA